MTDKSEATEAALAGEGVPEGVELGETKASLPAVKQVIRYVSRGAPNPEARHYSVDEVDEYLGFWISQGYKLFNTHYLGENPEGFGVLYILVMQ